jgi:hypothetical protein
MGMTSCTRFRSSMLPFIPPIEASPSILVYSQLASTRINGFYAYVGNYHGKRNLQGLANRLLKPEKDVGQPTDEVQ